MNLDRLRTQLKSEEGVSLKVYKDLLGSSTVGAGHLVTPAHNLRVSDVTSHQGCDELFRYDLAQPLAGCAKWIDGWDQFPDEVQEVLANMAFNLGVRS